MKTLILSFHIRVILILITTLFIQNQADAKVKLPKLVGDNMVLQRGVKIKIWGWADKKEKISVTFKDKEYSAMTDDNGSWLIMLEPFDAGGPFDMNIKSNKGSALVIKNILIGDVWVCSGQSNMELMLSDSYSAPFEIERANFPQIHLITLNNTDSPVPMNDINSTGWSTCSPETTKSFSAVGYFFGRELFNKYKIPIGLISSDWGGSPAEAWTSTDGLKEFPEFLKALQISQVDEKKKAELAKEFEIRRQKEIKNFYDSVSIIETGILSSWNKPNINTSVWDKMQLPVLWESAGLPDFDGIVWFRKEINIPKELAGKDIELNLGKIDDIDNTWFNGEEIGFTDGYNIDRKYKIPGKFVKEGVNIIAVRVVDTFGGGGVYGNKEDLKIIAGSQNISLAGDWNFKQSTEYKNMPKYPRNDTGGGWKPASLYNGMISPLLNFAIKGVIWYQGESNAGNPKQYKSLFPSMIKDWRKQWGLGDFPFLFVQLANWTPGGSSWPFLRDSQTSSLSVHNTGMAVTIDIGNPEDIHPKNKKEVGRRLALAAMKVAYNENVVYSGPTYESSMPEGSRIRINFKNTGKGLMAHNNDYLKNFMIAGEDKNFKPASAFIEGNSVLVESPEVLKPISVRYAWFSNPPDVCNFYNIEGLPAVPFKTDNWDY